VKSIPSWAKLLIKVCITGLCLWYVFTKIEWQQTWQTFISSNGFWLAMALLFFVLSKLVAAFRLNIYFKNIDAALATAQSIKLYWLGMFYNLFLPGGIGGDAYKVILINRKLKHPVKLLTAAVLLDRISGVAGIFCSAQVIIFCV